jgi:hypothetical protein
MDCIPILIICHNNYKYVDNTIKQLENLGLKKNIKIINNKSDEISTLEFLEKINESILVINNSVNDPYIYQNKEIYNSLPERFFITDPDLEFNKDLPSNFIDIMVNISDKYKLFKLGFALDISEENLIMNHPVYFNDKKIIDVEKSFWEKKIYDSEYELYDTTVDTTFCLITKSNLKEDQHKNNMRIAGDFTAKHIPWYINNDIYNNYELYKYYNKSVWSSIGTTFFFQMFINKQYIINKNNENVLVDYGINYEYMDFWLDEYKMIDLLIIDKIDKSKKIIIMCDEIGEITIYASRKFNKIISNSDQKEKNIFENNVKINCDNVILLNLLDANIDDIVDIVGTEYVLITDSENNNINKYFDDVIVIKKYEKKRSNSHENIVNFNLGWYLKYSKILDLDYAINMVSVNVAEKITNIYKRHSKYFNCISAYIFNMIKDCNGDNVYYFTNENFQFLYAISYLIYPKCIYGLLSSNNTIVENINKKMKMDNVIVVDILNKKNQYSNKDSIVIFDNVDFSEIVGTTIKDAKKIIFITSIIDLDTYSFVKYRRNDNIFDKKQISKEKYENLMMKIVKMYFGDKKYEETHTKILFTQKINVFEII